MYKKIGVLLSASVLATAGLVPIISNSNNVQAGTVDTVKDNSKLNYDDNESIDSWMPDKLVQEEVLTVLKTGFSANSSGLIYGTTPPLSKDATVKDITKKDMLLFCSFGIGDHDIFIDHISFKGLEYATNIESVAFDGYVDSEILASDEATMDISSLNNLPKLKYLTLDGYGPRHKNFFERYKTLYEKGVVIKMSGEYATYLDESLVFNKDNYKKLDVPINDLINLPSQIGFDFLFENLNFEINGHRLSYSVDYDENTRTVKFRLLTKGVKYSDLANRSTQINLAPYAEDGTSTVIINISNEYRGHYDLDIGDTYLFNKVEFAPENQNISDLTELYNKVKYSISYSGDVFNSQPGNSMKYKDEFNDKTMFGAMDHAYNSKDYDGLVKLMYDSIKKTHESIGSLQINEAKAKELGLNVDQLKSDLAKDSVPYDHSQDNDIDGINKQLDSSASVRAKYNKLVQQGIFDKSDYWTMNK